MENKHRQSSSKFNISLRVPLEISVVYSWGMCYIYFAARGIFFSYSVLDSFYQNSSCNQLLRNRSKIKSPRIMVPCLFTDLRARHQMYSVNDGPLFPIDKCTRKALKLGIQLLHNYFKTCFLQYGRLWKLVL